MFYINEKNILKKYYRTKNVIFNKIQIYPKIFVLKFKEILLYIKAK